MVKISGPVKGAALRKILNILLTKYPNVDAKYLGEHKGWEITAEKDEIKQGGPV